MMSSEDPYPCPVCHLSFKTEAKVSQHIEKCLASQDREERPSRSKNSNKRVAEDDDDVDGDSTNVKAKESKRSRKDDQVAAWSGIGLQSPSAETEKSLRNKTKKSEAKGTSSKNTSAKKSVPTGGKKNGRSENEKADESRADGKFGKDNRKSEEKENRDSDAMKRGSKRQKLSLSTLGWTDSEDEEVGGKEGDDRDPVTRDKNQITDETDEDFLMNSILDSHHPTTRKDGNDDDDDDIKTRSESNEGEAEADKRKRKKKTSPDPNGEEKEERGLKKRPPSRSSKRSLDSQPQKKVLSSPKTNSSKVSHVAASDKENIPSPSPPERQTKKPSTSEILKSNPRPLAETLRPSDLVNLFGQEFEKDDPDVNDNRPTDDRPSSSNQKTDIRWLRTLIKALAPIPSIIFWGPPGCGKTTLAKIIANVYGGGGAKGKSKSLYRFVTMSACESGVADVKKQAEVAKNELKMTKRRTLLFMDEIHRFTKNQQDAFLPIIENGTIVLLGATTENPSFSLNSALMSRCKVVVLNALSPANVRQILERGVDFLNGLVVDDEGKTMATSNDAESSNLAECIDDPSRVKISSTALDVLSHLADGDARIALNGLQTATQTFLASSSSKSFLDVSHVKESLQKGHVIYDRAGDQHYQLISAFHKSIRGSDDNAALYWLTRMLRGGEDPRYIARRLIRIATEDIGLGDPHGLVQATAAHQAVLAVGMPECDVALAQATIYLARARKSVEVYSAMKIAQNVVSKQMEGGMPSVPLHLRNGSTKLMRDMGYGKGYLYNPDCVNGEDEGQIYMPEGCETLDFFK